MQDFLHSGTMDEFLWIIYWSANQKCIYRRKNIKFSIYGLVVLRSRAPNFVFCSNLFSNQTVSKVYSCQWTLNKPQTIYRNSNSKQFKFAQKEMRGSCSICNQTYYQWSLLFPSETAFFSLCCLCLSSVSTSTFNMHACQTA